MNIQEHVNLKPYNTFQLDCIAAYFVEINTSNDLQELINTDLFQQSSHLVLGGGSNILLTKKHFDGLVIKNNILGRKIVKENKTSVTVHVGAGENRDAFVWRTIEQGYCGIENLVSIPGTVGAAPMQNIGAYGVEAGRYIVSVNYLDIESGEEIEISAKDCTFGYRDSIFKQTLKNKTYITHVTFILEKYNSETYSPIISYGGIQKKLDELFDELSVKEVDDSPEHSENLSRGVTPRKIATTIANIRASKLPDRKNIGTAGSFFKNPIISREQFDTLQQQLPGLKGFSITPPLVKGTDSFEHSDNLSGGLIKLSAGQLIDLAGLKGIKHGSVGTYNNHALVLVHDGGGSGEDILKLASYIQEKVSDMFGISIEPEVNYIKC